MKKNLAFLLIFVSSWFFSQTGYKLKVIGEVTQPLELTISELSKMPRTEASLKDKDGKIHIYKGVAVQDVLAKAGIPSGKELHGENLSKYLLVKSADGYQVIFSLAEFDSSVNDKNIILADEMDGKPIEKKGPIRLIVEGEKRPVRSANQVETLVIGKIEK